MPSMHKPAFRLANRIMVTVLLFCQAVFLLAPAEIALAETASVFNNTLNNIDTVARPMQLPVITKPNAPSGLTAELRGTSTVIIRWVDNSSNESGFKIYEYYNSMPRDIGNVNENTAEKYAYNQLPGTHAYYAQAYIKTTNPITSTTSIEYSEISNRVYLTIPVPIIETPQPVILPPVAATNTLPVAIATTTAQNPAPSITPTINFFETPVVLYASSRISVKTNFKPDSNIKFSVGTSTAIVGVLDGHDSVNDIFTYSFYWDLDSYDNGTYQIKAFASYGGTSVYKASERITLNKPVRSEPLIAESLKASSTLNLIASTSNATILSLKIIEPIANAVISNTISITAKTTGPQTDAKLFLDNALVGSMMLDPVTKNWKYQLNTLNFSNNRHALKVAALDYLRRPQPTLIDTVEIIIYNQKQATFIASASPQTIKPAQVAQTAPTTIVSPVQPSVMEINKAAIEPTKQTNVIATSVAVIGRSPTTNSTTTANQVVLNKTCINAGITDPIKCENHITKQPLPTIQQIAQSSKLPQECINANIRDIRACEVFLQSEYMPDECLANNLADKNACVDFIHKRYGKPAECNRLKDDSCAKLVSQVILSNYTDKATIDQAQGELERLNGKYISFKTAAASTSTEVTIKEDTETLPATEEGMSSRAVEKILPFKVSGRDLGLMVLATTTPSTRSFVNAVLAIDSDADGLTDDFERRIGSNPQNADTDQDGYGDGVEVRGGYNPMGKGSLNAEIFPIEKALLNKASLEQPRVAGITKSESFRIEKIENTDSKRIEGVQPIRLQGRGAPNQIVTIYIYSPLPIVMTVATDENGNWTYNLDRSLVDGKHEAYVVINDENGKISQKSSPFSFFIKEARAVSQNEFIGAEFNVPDRTQEMNYWYILASLFLIIVGIGLYFLYAKTKDHYVIN